MKYITIDMETWWKETIFIHHRILSIQNCCIFWNDKYTFPLLLFSSDKVKISCYKFVDCYPLLLKSKLKRKGPPIWNWKYQDNYSSMMCSCSLQKAYPFWGKSYIISKLIQLIYFFKGTSFFMKNALIVFSKGRYLRVG